MLSKPWDLASKKFLRWCPSVRCSKKVEKKTHPKMGIKFPRQQKIDEPI
jgi:hypothetical protein